MGQRLYAFVAVGLCVVLCGCVMRSANSPSSLNLMREGLGEPASFSDEVSRDLVRQTRELLALRDQDYLVGPDDVLEISIFEWEMTEEAKTLDFRVSESGAVSLPVLGVVPVAGKTLQGVQEEIERELSGRNVLQNPRVAVAVKEYRSRRISVIGAVNAPGVYALHENVSTLMDMLSLAGGPAAGAGEIAYVLRGAEGESEPLRIVVDMEELFERGRSDLNAVLRDGDVVYVPKAPLIYIYGAVRQPGGFPLHRSMRVLEALALAGGFSDRAAKRSCRLLRRSETASERVVDLNVVRIEQCKAPNLFLRDGDVLYAPESPGKTIASELWNVLRGVFTFTYRLNSE